MVESGSRPQWCNYQAKPATFHAKFGRILTSSLWTTSESSWNIKQGSKDFWGGFSQLTFSNDVYSSLFLQLPIFLLPKKKCQEMSPPPTEASLRTTFFPSWWLSSSWFHPSFRFFRNGFPKTTKTKKKQTKEAIRHKWVDSTLPLSF